MRLTVQLTAVGLVVSKVQGSNEPCLFVHPVTGHKVLMHVDDLLCGGSIADSEYFYSRLAERFDCKSEDF